MELLALAVFAARYNLLFSKGLLIMDMEVRFFSGRWSVWSVA